MRYFRRRLAKRMCLNHDFDFDRDAGPQTKAAFSGDVRRVLLPVDARLWKWTEHDLPTGTVSPWWAPLEPEGIDGFEDMANLQEIERQVRIRGGGARSALRHALAILPEWNSMGKMLIVTLTRPAFGFAGFASMQQMNDLDGHPMPIYLGGGYGQLFIPNLTSKDLKMSEPREELLRLGIADAEFYVTPFTTERPAFGSLQPKTQRLLKLFGLAAPDE
jgi:hypothetical protein